MVKKSKVKVPEIVYRVPHEDRDDDTPCKVVLTYENGATREEKGFIGWLDATIYIGGDLIVGIEEGHCKCPVSIEVVKE